MYRFFEDLEVFVEDCISPIFSEFFAFLILFHTFSLSKLLMEFKVFGCKTNRYFAEKWLAHPHLDGKEGYFIASCVVTDKAKAKWVKHAKKRLNTLDE